MKKTALILSIILAIYACLSVTVFAITGNTDEKTAAELFNEYYNEGVYTRYNEIYLSENSEGVFHGPVVTKKTTYFTGNTLWMDTNSGYTSSEIGADAQLDHFTLNDQNQMENVQSYGNLGDINSFFKTMKTFADNGNGAWTALADGGFVTTDENTLLDVMAFAASCFTNKGGFVTLERAEIKEEGDSLVFYLYVIEEDANKLEPVSTLLAKTAVTKGVSSFVINE